VILAGTGSGPAFARLACGLTLNPQYPDPAVTVGSAFANWTPRSSRMAMMMMARATMVAQQ
jgi:hypothetical protein